MTLDQGHDAPLSPGQQLCVILSRSNLAVRSYGPDTDYGYVCTLTLTSEYFAEDINKINIIQRRAASYVTGRHSNTSSVSDMMHHLQWRTLADRHTDFRLAMFYKIVNDKVAIPKTDRLIPPSQTLTQHAYTFFPNSSMLYSNKTKLLLSPHY